MFVENSIESHKPVENQRFTLAFDSKVPGILRVPPGAERPLRAVKGQISLLAGLD